MAETSQDPAAVITYLDDWTAHLAALPGTGITISSVTSVVADKGATVSTPTATTTGVEFQLDVSAVTGTPTVVTTTTTVVLSNGDTDVRHHTVQVTST